MGGRLDCQEWSYKIAMRKISFLLLCLVSKLLALKPDEKKTVFQRISNSWMYWP